MFSGHQGCGKGSPLLASGIYSMHYLVRSVTPGTYDWPGSQAFLEYAPEEFGRSASARAEITP